MPPAAWVQCCDWDFGLHSSWWDQNHGVCSSLDLHPMYYGLSDSILDKEPPLCVPEERKQLLYWRPAEVLGAPKGTLNSNIKDLLPYTKLMGPSLSEISFFLVLYVHVQLSAVTMAVLYSFPITYFRSMPWHPVRCSYQVRISFGVSFKVHMGVGKRSH